MESTLNYIETLTAETHKSESEVIAMAIETGVKQMWREHILGRYLRKEISRFAAIEQIGIDWVEFAEHQHEAVLEDLAWARSS